MTLLQGNWRMIKLGLHIIDYLKDETTLLESPVAVHNISSDIIESIFGAYKARKSPNKLCGVTPFVLFIPAYTKLANKKDAKKFDFKQRLVNVKLKDIDEWAAKNLSTNWVSERIKKLALTG